MWRLFLNGEELCWSDDGVVVDLIVVCFGELLACWGIVLVDGGEIVGEKVDFKRLVNDVLLILVMVYGDMGRTIVYENHVLG